MFFVGLYSAAVMLSGHSLNSWALTRNPLNFAKSVALALGVSTINIKDMVEGLRKKSAEELQKAVNSRYIMVSNFVRIYIKC